MILLLTVPFLGQAGVKRLQISQRRTRWEKQLPEILSVPNRRDINRYVDIAAPYSLKSTYFHIPGLTSNPMFTRTSVSSHSLAHQLAAGQSCRFAFSVTPSNSACSTAEFKSRSGASALDNSGSAPKTPWKNSLADVLAPIVLCFSRITYRPRPPVVQALQEV
jgi:hypothetical protein